MYWFLLFSAAAPWFSAEFINQRIYLFRGHSSFLRRALDPNVIALDFVARF